MTEPDPISDAAIVITRAKVHEVAQLLSLLDEAVPECSPETVWQLPYNWAHYVVAKLRGSEKLLAAGSLQPVGPGRKEIRGLVVSRECRGQGLATTIVNHLIEEAETQGTQTVCVTRRPSFFRRLGFHDTPPNWLTSHRVFGDVAKAHLPQRVSLARDPRALQPRAS